MKDQLIVQNFINAFDFIHCACQPTLSQIIPFDYTAFMTAKQIWIQNIKDTSQQATQLKNKAQQLMRVLQYDYDAQDNINVKKEINNIYQFKNKLHEKNKIQRQQYSKQQQKQKQKQRLSINSQQIKVQLKGKKNQKDKQKPQIIRKQSQIDKLKNINGKRQFRDENVDHSNSQILKEYFCEVKPSFYNFNVKNHIQDLNLDNSLQSFSYIQPIQTPNKYNPKYYNNSNKSKPATRIVQLNKMQYKKQVPNLSQINKVYLNQSLQPTIIESQNTKLKVKAQCLHINYECCHEKCGSKGCKFDQNERIQLGGKIKSININDKCDKKQRLNTSYEEQNRKNIKRISYQNKYKPKQQTVTNRISKGRGRTYTQSIQSDHNSKISQYIHQEKVPGRKIENLNKTHRIENNHVKSTHNDSYYQPTAYAPKKQTQSYYQQPIIQTEVDNIDEEQRYYKITKNNTQQQPIYHMNYTNYGPFNQNPPKYNNLNNTLRQRQKAQLFQDDLDVNDQEFIEQQALRQKMEALQQQYMRQQQQKIQSARKIQQEKQINIKRVKQKKKQTEFQQIKQVKQQMQKNKRLQQKKITQNYQQQNKKEHHLFLKLREQFSSIGQQQHNQDEKKVSDQIKQLQVKLNQIISNNNKSKRANLDHSPSTKVVKLNLNPSRSNLLRNNAINCNKNPTPRSSVNNKSNSLISKRISCLNSRVI